MLHIVFYKVGNSKEYGRHSFDCMNGHEVLKTITENLDEDEYHIFETTLGWDSKFPNLSDFQEMYNDCELDANWWTIVISI